MVDRWSRHNCCLIAPHCDGRSGEDVIRRIKGLPFNPPNADSLFFKAGKAGGDKRALVAERGFYRPFSKIVITNAGIVDE